MNWPREGCAVCSLDLTAEPANWKEAVIVAVMEIRRLGLHGLTQGELNRYCKMWYFGDLLLISMICAESYLARRGRYLMLRIRYKQAVLGEAQQYVAQSDRMASEVSVLVQRRSSRLN